MTPRTYKQRSLNIEKWVSLQRQEIAKSKQDFREEWDKTIQMIEETQKNVDYMKLKLNNSGADSSGSYSQASSRQNNNAKDKRSQSILIDDPPKSYRSARNQPTHPDADS